MNILLLGVPGAGKTTLGKQLSRGGYVYYESSGERKKKMLEKLSIDKSLSEMNQIESTLINALYFSNLYEYSMEGSRGDDWHRLPLLVDTHASYMLPQGIFVNLLPANLTQEEINGAIILKAKPEIIKERRISRGRDKDSVDVETIQWEIHHELKATTEFVNKTGIPLLLVDNSLDWCYDDVVGFIEMIERMG